MKAGHRKFRPRGGWRGGHARPERQRPAAGLAMAARRRAGVDARRGGSESSRKNLLMFLHPHFLWLLLLPLAVGVCRCAGRPTPPASTSCRQPPAPAGPEPRDPRPGPTVPTARRNRPGRWSRWSIARPAWTTPRSSRPPPESRRWPNMSGAQRSAWSIFGAERAGESRSTTACRRPRTWLRCAPRTGQRHRRGARSRRLACVPMMPTAKCICSATDAKPVATCSPPPPGLGRRGLELTIHELGSVRSRVRLCCCHVRTPGAAAVGEAVTLTADVELPVAG